jgi:acyl-coenzyme A thioesterase PaaI-like protein
MEGSNATWRNPLVGKVLVVELCFGCGEDNPIGLHLHFEVLPSGAVQAKIRFGEELSGEPGIIHGGIQATVLDEVMGRAVQLRVREHLGRPSTSVTASFQLRYRRPSPTNVWLAAEGWATELSWPSVLASGHILDGDGQVLTEATARWRVLDGPGEPEA